MPGDDHLGLALAVTPWLMPYFFLIGAGVFAMGPLFVMQRYSTASWSPALLNVALMSHVSSPATTFPTLFALVAYCLALAASPRPPARRHETPAISACPLELRHPGVRKAMLLLVPIVLGQATGEVNKVVDAFFAFKLEAVSYLYYANRLVQLPLSVFGLAVAVAILPSISAAGAREDYGEIRATLAHGFRQSAFLVMPALAGLLILREPIMQLLFAHEGGAFSPEEARHAANALFYLAWGLLFFSWVKVGVQGFYAVHNTATPVIVASLSMALNIALNLALVGPWATRASPSPPPSPTPPTPPASPATLPPLRQPAHPDFARGLIKILLASTAMGCASSSPQCNRKRLARTAHGAELARVLIPSHRLLTYPAACRLLRPKTSPSSDASPAAPKANGTGSRDKNHAKASKPASISRVPVPARPTASPKEAAKAGAQASRLPGGEAAVHFHPQRLRQRPKNARNRKLPTPRKLPPSLDAQVVRRVNF